MIGYPITYGDSGGSFVLSRKQVRIVKIISLALIPTVIAPVVVHAVDNTDLLLLRLEKAISELEGTSSVTRQISPVGATACIISGICMSQAKQAAAAGNMPAAAAFTCGAAVAMCGDRVAASYGL